MFVNSIGRYGDRVALTSPKYETASEPQAIAFQYYVQQEDINTGGALEVYVLSEEKVPEMILLRKDDNYYNSWVEAVYRLPKETSIYVMFVATLGLPFVSNVMIRNVMVNSGERWSNNGNVQSNSIICVACSLCM